MYRKLKRYGLQFARLCGGDYMVFQVNYTETLCGSYILEGNSEEEVIEEFQNMISAGAIDTLDLEVVDINIDAEVVGNKDRNGGWVYEPPFIQE